MTSEEMFKKSQQLAANTLRLAQMAGFPDGPEMERLLRQIVAAKPPAPPPPEPDHAFSVGDLVVLPSGGPAMTVAEVVGQTVRARWFNVHEDLRDGVFATATLEAYDCLDDDEAFALEDENE